jgi:hypothetical protein
LAAARLQAALTCVLPQVMPVLGKHTQSAMASEQGVYFAYNMARAEVNKVGCCHYVSLSGGIQGWVELIKLCLSCDH